MSSTMSRVTVERLAEAPGLTPIDTATPPQTQAQAAATPSAADQWTPTGELPLLSLRGRDRAPACCWPAMQFNRPLPLMPTPRPRHPARPCPPAGKSRNVSFDPFFDAYVPVSQPLRCCLSLLAAASLLLPLCSRVSMRRSGPATSQLPAVAQTLATSEPQPASLPYLCYSPPTPAAVQHSPRTGELWRTGQCESASFGWFRPSPTPSK